MFCHFHFQKTIQGVYLLLENLDQLSDLNVGFVYTCFRSDWYLFQLTVLLKPDFTCWSNFALSWVDKVTTGEKIFVSVIANYSAPVEFVIMTQIDGHVKIRLTS